MDLELSDEDEQCGYFGGKSQHYPWINNLFWVKANRCKTSKHICENVSYCTRDRGAVLFLSKVLTE